MLFFKNANTIVYFNVKNSAPTEIMEDTWQ